jgi:protein-L-isoaspartate(D-aspartate) O-methyltransferase
MMVARQLEARGIRDRRVLDAMRQIERHRFVPERLQDSAYDDGPQPIGEGQTISQPYMVASMSEELGLVGSETVLEVGTGSGYQTAILAKLAARVISIERHDSLAIQARALLADMGLTNVQIEVGDGSLGWPEQAGFGAILVTAGAPEAPRALLEQLLVGARLVVPVGNRYDQVIEVHQRTDAQSWTVRRSTACRFVRLIGEQGWRD